MNYDRSLLRYLDEQQISVSGGSACSTGSGSHVLQVIYTDSSKHNIRFLFSKLNTFADTDRVIETLVHIYQTLAA